MKPWAFIGNTLLSHRGLWPRVNQALFHRTIGSTLCLCWSPMPQHASIGIQSELVNAKAKGEYIQMHSSFVSAG